MPERNPFTPSFGSEPLVMAGREDIVSSMQRAFENGVGDPRLTSVFIGARGTGKTALLNEVPGIAAEHGWVCASSTALPGMLEDLYQRAHAAASELMEPEAQTRLTGITVGNALGLEWEHPDAAEGNWRTRMYEVLDALEEQGSGLLFTVDEVRADLDEMVLFASVYQHFVREQRNVALLMAGLPGNVSRLLSHKSASYLRRSKQFRLKRIPDASISKAVRQTVESGGGTIDSDALDLAVRAIDGFPYMMQLVGFNMWEQALPNVRISRSDAETGIELALADMRDSIYQNTLAELSNGDVAFLEAMLPDDAISLMADVIKRMGVSASYASQYRLRLIDQGVIGERGRGRLGFDIPGFKDYLREELG